MTLREQFEKKFPVPDGVCLSDSGNIYLSNGEDSDSDYWDAADSHTKLWQGFQAGHAQGLEDAAEECERMVMYPGGRQEAPAHDNVWDAAAAIRAINGEVK